MTNPNVLKAIADMEENLVKLESADPQEARLIFDDANTCSQLMDYSHYVADTASDEWKRLEHLVDQVIQKSVKKANYFR